MDPCFAWCCYMGYHGCFVGVVEFEDEFFLRGVECDTPIFWKEVKLLSLFSFMFCGIGVWSFRRHSLENSRSFGIFPLGSGAQRGERVWAIDLDPVDGSPPLLPNPSRRPPSPSPQLVAAAPPPSLALLPIGSRPLPSPWLPPPSRSPPRSKDREEEEHVELKRKRGSRRCSSPSLEDLLGENPRYGW
jgi:hypothetical protein